MLPFRVGSLWHVDSTCHRDKYTFTDIFVPTFVHTSTAYDTVCSLMLINFNAYECHVTNI